MSRKNPVVIIIDDEESIRTSIKFILEKEGLTVFEATDGTAGLALASDHTPDLIITDLVMPNKEGIETIRELRSRFPACTIIAMSGAANSNYYLSMASCLGANHTIRKPFERSDLVDAVRKFLIPCNTASMVPSPRADTSEPPSRKV